MRRIEDRFKVLAADVGAVAPRYIRFGELIVVVAPDGGNLDGYENVAVIDLRRPVDLGSPESLAG